MSDNLPPQWHRRIVDVVTTPDAHFVVKDADGAPVDSVILSALSTGLVKVVGGTGALETAVAGTDYVAITDGHLVKKQSATIALATLQAKGAVTFGSFNVGATFPANVRVLSAELVVDEALAGGEMNAVGTVQSAVDTAGTLVNAADLTTAGHYSVGLNPYPSRGAHQVTLSVTTDGTNLEDLSAGIITVNLFYVIIA